MPKITLNTVIGVLLCVVLVLWIVQLVLTMLGYDVGLM
jgi:hypothetical protein